jgi:subtilisin family serine protease
MYLLLRDKILFLLLASSLIAYGQRPAGAEQYKIMVKLEAAASQTARSSMDKGRMAAFGTGNRGIDRLNERFGTKSMMPMIASAKGQIQKRHADWGIDRWYEITINQPATEAVLMAFMANPAVEHAEFVYEKVRIESPAGFFSTNDPDINKQWHYNNTGQTNGTPRADMRLFEAWQIERGLPEVIVSIHDGGIDVAHPDLAAAMWVNTAELNGAPLADDDNNGYTDDIYGYNFAHNSGTITADNHGTHVAGTVGAVSNNGLGVAGVAGGSGPSGGVRLMSCQVFGNLKDGGFAQSFIYAADNGAVISQNSWGYSSENAYEQSVIDAIDYFIANAGKDKDGNQIGPMSGGLVVFAAGNSNKDQNRYPAMYSPVVAVAGTNHKDKKSWYSNFADWVDISAPGGEIDITREGVLSTMPASSYGFMQGTSMACPHVSGVAALLVSKYGGPGLTPDFVRNRLVKSTDNIEALNPLYAGKLGSGRLNAARALHPAAVEPPSLVQASAVSPNNIKIKWQSESFSPYGALWYELRYSENFITEENFSLAQLVASVPHPQPEGELDSIIVTMLNAETKYYFAFRLMNIFGDISVLSEVVSAETFGYPVLSISPEVVLESVKADSVKQIELAVCNTGKSALGAVFSIEAAQGQFLSLVSQPEISLAPGLCGNISLEIDATGLYEGDFYSGINFTSNDPHKSQGTITCRIDVNGQPVISVTDSTSFTEAYTAYPYSVYLPITNSGTADLLINSINIEGSFLTHGAIPDAIARGATDSLLLEFSATDSGAYIAEIIIISNCGVNPEVRVQFYLRAVYPPVAELSPEIQTLHAASGSTQTIYVNIANSGQSVLKAQLGCGGFYRAVSAHYCNNLKFSAADILLHPGASVGLPVEINTYGLPEGLNNFEISLHSNDPLNPVLISAVELGIIAGAYISAADTIYAQAYKGIEITVPVIIENRGQQNLEISSIYTAAGIFAATQAPAVILPGNTETAYLSFTPEARGLFADTLVIESSCAENGLLKIPAVIYAVAHASARISPSAIKASLCPEGNSKHLIYIAETNSDEALQYHAQIENKVETPDISLFDYSYRHGAGADIGYQWQDISSSGTIIPLSGDDNSASLSLPFPFPFYGNSYSSLLVSTNGYLTFGTSGNSYTPQIFPNSNTPNNIIAPFWYDLRSRGEVYMLNKPGENKLIIQYTDYTDYNQPSTSYTFQVHLYSSGKIVYTYGSMSPVARESLSVGIENPNGTAGLNIEGAKDLIASDFAIIIDTGKPSGDFIAIKPDTGGNIDPGAGKYLEIELNASSRPAGTYTADIVIRSNDVFKPAITVPVELTIIESANIYANFIDGSLDTVAGAKKTHSAKIRNLGTEPLNIKSAISNSLHFVTDFQPAVVPVGGFIDFNITFQAADTGLYAANIFIESNDKCKPMAELAIKAQSAEAPIAHLAPAEINIRLIAGQSAQRALNISNAAKFPELEWSLKAGSVNFMPLASNENSNFPNWLVLSKYNGLCQAGITDSITVSFNTTGLDAGLYSVDILAFTNDPLRSAISIPVSMRVLEGCQADSVYQNYSLCAGDSVFTAGRYISEPGLHSLVLENQIGCDSIVYVNIAHKQVYSYDSLAYACSGFEWYGSLLTLSGSYTKVFESSLGCDSTITLNLEIYPLENAVPQTVQACGRYSWHGTDITESGTYFHTLQSIRGCDSVLELNLEIYPLENAVPQTVQACGRYSWHGTDITESGTYFHTLHSIRGCDSVLELNLEIYPLENAVPQTVQACGRYSWHGTDITESGTYFHTLHSIRGCDSVLELNLEIYPLENAVPQTVQACGRYSWHGTDITESGTYFHTLQSIRGCDSVLELNLEIYPLENAVPQTVQACGLYSWHGTDITESGTYFHTLQSIRGCDSVLELNLEIYPLENAVPQTVQACGLYSWHGTDIAESGTYFHTLQSIRGCDSVLELNLEIYPLENAVPQTVQACGLYSWHGTDITESGTYFHTLQSIRGCDSVLELNLEIYPLENAVPQTVQACGLYSWHGTDITESGTYFHTLQSIRGCDSVLELNLEIYPLENAVPQTVQACGLYSWHGTDIAESGTYFHTLQSIRGCDSVLELNLEISAPYYADTLEVKSCTSVQWEGISADFPGLYSVSYNTVSGCDSVLSMQVVPGDIISGDTIRRTVCGREIQDFESISYSGHTIVHTAANGCDSLVYVSIEIIAPVYHHIDTAHCGSLSYNGLTYNESGTYTLMEKSASGCDSIIKLNITIKEHSVEEIHETYCGAHIWHGEEITESGTHVQVVSNEASCDETTIFHFTINTVKAAYDTIYACGGFVWQGQDIKESGNYTSRLETASGCDSVLNLYTLLHSPATSYDTVSSCGAYLWNGKLLGSSGSYTHSATGIYGCDSIAQLELLIIEPDAAVAVQDGILKAINTEAESYSWFLCAQPEHAVHGATGPVFYPQASGVYALEITERGCKAVSYCYYINADATGYAQHKLMVMPNPASCDTYVHYPGTERILLSCPAGRQLWQSLQYPAIPAQVPLCQLSEGVYIITIETASAIHHIKIIKE